MTYHRPSKNWRSPTATERPCSSVSFLRYSSAVAESSPHIANAYLAFDRNKLILLFLWLRGHAKLKDLMHTMYFKHTHQVKGIFPGKTPTLQYNVCGMRKDTALSFRIPRRLKAELERVALNEGRSLSQVCEALLTGGLTAYKKEGAKYLQRLLSRQSKDDLSQ